MTNALPEETRTVIPYETFLERQRCFIVGEAILDAIEAHPEDTTLRDHLLTLADQDLDDPKDRRLFFLPPKRSRGP